MDMLLPFKKFREKYKTFYYNSYKITEDSEAFYITYEFEIENLTKFLPSIKVLKKNFPFKPLVGNAVNNMVFHIGLIELVSYWKCTCSPKVIIKCGHLNEEQINWWKKLYFYGLGELFYTNHIQTTLEDFMSIECIPTYNELPYDEITDSADGYIIPVGGGKDSIVTLETLPLNTKTDYCLIINPKPVTLQCAKLAGFENSSIIEIFRKIDSHLIELNQKGFINGHTPFSAMLAFVSYFICYLLGKKYVALSNENSANEANVVGRKINHQYSKSFEFECDFREYAQKYLKAPVSYFSFLRPLNELQIAKIFAKHTKYHTVFRSCNIGSKETVWKWCCNCSKCLFAYIILSPYLSSDQLTAIFGTNLLEKKELLETFLELTGNAQTKPFDCVGTFEEVNFAVSKTIENLESTKQPLPYLLAYYRSNFSLANTNSNITKQYCEENCLTEEQNTILRNEVFGND